MSEQSLSTPDPVWDLSHRRAHSCVLHLPPWEGPSECLGKVGIGMAAGSGVLTEGQAVWPLGSAVFFCM